MRYMYMRYMYMRTYIRREEQQRDAISTTHVLQRQKAHLSLALLALKRKRGKRGK